jgi:hypothetical protein
MADVILSVGGQVIGGAIGGPIGAAIGGAIGGAIGQTFTPTQKFQGPRLGDLRVTGTEYGQTIPWVAGSPRISGQIIWASAKREIANTVKQGKGGGGGAESTTYTYEVDVAYLLSENPIAGVSRIWINGELVGLVNGGVPTGNWFIDGVLELSGQLGNGKFSEFRVYTGTDDQMPDSIIEAVVGVGNTPAYRGRGYCVIKSLQLGGSGQIPNITFEIAYAKGSQVLPEYVFKALQDTGTYVYDDSIAPEWPGTLADPGDVFTLLGDGVRTGDAESGSDLIQWINPVIGSNKINTATYPGEDVTFAIKVTELKVREVAGTNTTNTGFVLRLVVGGQINLGWNVGVPFQSGIPGIFASYTDPFGPSVLVPLIDGLTVDYDLKIVFPKEGDRIEWWIEGFGIPLYLAYTLFGSGLGAPATILAGLSRNGLNVPKITQAAIGDLRVYRGGADAESQIILTEEPLSDVITNLSTRAGYTTSQFELPEIINGTDIVRAAALSQVSSTRSTLELLQSAYFFEASKDERIKFFPRQTLPVVTIPYADLGFSFDGGDQEQLVLTNSNDLELPAQIAVQYANMLADYQAGTEFSDRLLTEQESTNVVQLALGLRPIEAKTIADRMLSDLIAGQWRFTIKLPLKYAYLMPGDIFNVVARDGRSFRGRIQSKKDSQVLIELECVLDSVGTLDVDAATDANYVSQGVILDPSVTEWESLDIPLLRDADNNVSWYSAMGPVLVEDTRWPGGVIVQSFGGSAYTQLYSTGDVSAIGECDTTLGNWTHGAMFDETNTLTVTLYAGELESVARADMLLDQELNAAAVGVDGQWEIIRFRNAELTGSTSTGLNIYKLSGLLRGQRGTEWAIGLHGADERFVLLDTTIRNIPSQLNELNLERFIKGVTSNTPLNDVTERSFTHTGVSLKPFSVAQLRALPDGSDIEVTWNRRTRLSYRYAGINPVVPLGEATEAYRVWIYDGSTLVRTENVTTDSYTYAAADIASDGFASTDTIRIEVAQVSAIVGAGYIEEVEVIAP